MLTGDWDIAHGSRAKSWRDETVQPPEEFFGGGMITWMVCGQLLKLRGVCTVRR
jgi:hypothetical protein